MHSRLNSTSLLLLLPGSAGHSHFEIVAYYRKILHTHTHTQWCILCVRAHTYKCCCFFFEIFGGKGKFLALWFAQLLFCILFAASRIFLRYFLTAVFPHMSREGGCYAREECFENKLVRNSIFGCAAVAAFNEKFMNSQNAQKCCLQMNLFDFFKSPHMANINL